MFWLPVIGPILQGIVGGITSIFNKKLDKEIEEVKDSTQIIHDTKDDIGIRLNRDLLVFPVVVYCGTYVWDKWIEIQHPTWVWGVKPLEGPLAYLIPATIVFLLGNIGINAWKGR